MINIFPTMPRIDPCLSAANSNIENSERHSKTIPFKEHLITFYLVKLMSHVVCHWKALINGVVCAAYKGVSICSHLSTVDGSESMCRVTCQYFPHIEASLCVGIAVSSP
jgi:hypothetical protein